MNLRANAEMRPCMIRIPEVCSHNDAETVLCHARLAGITGVGQKAPDLLGAWGCMHCHAEVDGRTRKVQDRGAVKIAFYEGVLRTQNVLIREGRVTW
jgi:hypothetical protein